MSNEIKESDPNSFSNPEQCVVTDIDLNVEVDFKKKILTGYVEISVERTNPKADLFLDTRNLTIHNVKNKNKKMTFVLHDAHEIFGSKLEIKLPKTATKKFTIRIDYETSPKATGLMWLDPSQTAGKEKPYLLSQNEPIHARSMLPCQDTPGVKAPYTATITAPFDLVVLMSAVREGEEMDEDPLMKKYKFVQKIPIPSYLFAIAVGALESRKIGPRSHVWCEKEFVDKAAEEFSETEEMLQIAEDLLGPYVWGNYDLLVLPPSFIYGGMENPCLTFLTPTLLAGDKSLVAVVAHEISHSWMGNLVTNCNFQHFWLNEGFTVFVERKIIGRMHGEAHRQFDAITAWKDLKYCIDVKEVDDPLTKLIPDLKGIDPDEAFSIVPYEKGHTLLYHLEEILGGAEVFEKFLRDYIEEFKMKSIITDDWRSYLYNYFPDKKEILDKVDWDAWLYTPGMPPVKPEYDNSLGEKCITLCHAWAKASNDDLKQFKTDDVKGMASCQIDEFLSLLLEEEPLSIPKILKMNEEYGFGDKNSDILFRWIRLGLRAKWKGIIPKAVKFITEQGRMKFTRPIYRDLSSWKETTELAITTYKEDLPNMMHMAATYIAKDIGLST